MLNHSKAYHSIILTMDIPKQIFGINAIIIRQFLQLSSFIDEIDGIDVMIEGKQKSWAKLENICRRKKN